jgi:hypothetical protein
MRGDLQAAGVRPLPRVPRRRWFEWIRALRRDHRRRRLRQVEVIERLAAEERRARRRGAYDPASLTPRHWF